MMYLSRMQLNPRRRASLRFQADPQAMHAAVAASFPPGAEPRALWRLDRDADQLDLYVVSQTVPSFEHLQEQAGWGAHPTWDTRDYRPILNRIQRGDQYAFRIVANPVHTVTFEDGRKRRVAHVSVRHQTRWLTERAETIGVRFLRPGERPSGNDSSKFDSSFANNDEAGVFITERRRREFGRRGDRVTIVQVQYEGALEVVDVDLLREAMCSGIGRAKAYGCGLLTLAPLNRD